jgi:heme-degrading monooxygenase HmoA
MYGTIARLSINPGMESELMALAEDFGKESAPGLVGQYVYRTDADPTVYYLVVMFESREAYRANAESPEQHHRYERYRAVLAAEPEWHDGEIIWGGQPAA